MQTSPPFTYKKFILLFVIIGFISGLFISFFSDRLSSIKIDSSTAEASFQYFIGVIWGIIIWIAILFTPVNEHEKRSLLWLWTVRCFITLGVMLVYESVYSLDASLYYKDAISGNYTFSWSDFHGTNTVTALVAFLNNTLPIFNSYHALKVIFSFLGFTGAWIFYKAFTLHAQANIKLLWIIALFPSSLFWSSILGKDPLTFLGLSIFTYGIAKLYKEISINSFVYMFLGFGLLATVRFWLPIIFAMPILFTYIFSKTKSSNTYFVKYLSVFTFVVLFYFLFNFFLQRVNFTSLLDAYERVNMMSRSWSSGGSSQSVPVFSSWIDLVKFIPVGSFTALFRPLPGEINNPFGIISGIENSFLLIFFVKSFSHRNININFSAYKLYTLTTVFVWSFIYAFFSYQNLGTAVRFKLQILPFMLFLIHLGFNSKSELQSEK